VSIADTTPNDSDPSTLEACAPTIAAPAVLAIVFSDNIAAKGRSTLALKRASFLTPGLSESTLIFTNVGVALNNTLSIREHKKEIASAPTR
jgi:hypothetical protein